MRRYSTLVATLGLLLLSAVSRADNLALGTDICAMRPDLCDGKPVHRNQVHGHVRVQQRVNRAPQSATPARRAVLAARPAAVRSPAAASWPTPKPMTFDDYLNFNAANPAMHMRIPDHQTAFVDARQIYSADAPVQQDATLGAANPANTPGSFNQPDQFNSPGDTGSFSSNTSTGFGAAAGAPANTMGAPLPQGSAEPYASGGAASAPASAAPVGAASGNGDSTPIR